MLTVFSAWSSVAEQAYDLFICAVLYYLFRLYVSTSVLWHRHPLLFVLHTMTAYSYVIYSLAAYSHEVTSYAAYGHAGGSIRNIRYS